MTKIRLVRIGLSYVAAAYAAMFFTLFLPPGIDSSDLFDPSLWLAIGAAPVIVILSIVYAFGVWAATGEGRFAIRAVALLAVLWALSFWFLCRKGGFAERLVNRLSGVAEPRTKRT